MDDNVKKWFKQHRRDLPWRNHPTPYQVWISEVMLQQTQVAVVIPYYEKWMKQFPTITTLAHANVEEVIKCWEGLGYYSRARNLHAGARYLVLHFGGELTVEALDHIKGIGPYTKGAILSFAFKQKAPAVDGNVMRVLSRYWNSEAPIDQPKTRQILEKKVLAILPDKEPWLVSEGLIELGATICQKAKPKCSDCPLRSDCLAYRHGRVDQLPIKAKKVATTPIKRQVALVHCKGKILVKKGERGKVMADLYEFPYVEEGEAFNFDVAITKITTMPPVTHTFTRYKVTLIPTLYEAVSEGEGEWVDLQNLNKLPFSSGHKRLLSRLLNKYY